jgi:RNase P subunit RPR2
MQLLQNTPISCRKCRASVPGREYLVKESSGRQVMKCDWRCLHCGMHNKSGITRIVKEADFKK